MLGGPQLKRGQLTHSWAVHKYIQIHTNIEISPTSRVLTCNTKTRKCTHLHTNTYKYTQIYRIPYTSRVLARSTHAHTYKYTQIFRFPPTSRGWRKKKGKKEKQMMVSKSWRGTYNVQIHTNKYTQIHTNIQISSNIESLDVQHRQTHTNEYTRTHTNTYKSTDFHEHQESWRATLKPSGPPLLWMRAKTRTPKLQQGAL